MQEKDVEKKSSICIGNRWLYKCAVVTFMNAVFIGVDYRFFFKFLIVFSLSY